MKKKIVYVIGGLYASNGMANVLSTKANYLAENTDYQVYIILTEKKGTPFFYQLSPLIQTVNFNINFDELDTMPIYKKLFYYYTKQRKYKQEFRDYLMEIKPDITVTAMRREINFINSIPDGSKKVGEIHFNKSNYRQFDKKYLPASVNHFISEYWMGQLIKEIKKLSRFVVLSEEDCTKWTELSCVQVIHNPLSFFPKDVSSCSSKKVIAAGRYDKVKGFDRLIDAWSIVSAQYPDWNLHIYGAGDNESYNQLAKEKGLAESIHCEKEVENIASKFIESSIFVLSSRFEGFGMTIVEAMACGVPAISFNCPCGPNEIIKDGEDGLLVENGNIEQLAKKICYLIKHENVRKEMGRKARINVERFRKENIMQQWLKLFKEL